MQHSGHNMDQNVSALNVCVIQYMLSSETVRSHVAYCVLMHYSRSKGPFPARMYFD